MADSTPAAKVPAILDLNHNGIPDYQEPWLYQTMFKIGLFIARIFAPEHTMFRRGMEAVDGAMRQVKIP